MSYNRKELSRVPRSKEQAKAAYDRLSRWYDLLTGGFEARYRNRGIRELNPKEGEIILEIGFGTGHSILALAQAVGSIGKVYGVDISRGMIGVTRVKVSERGLRERVELLCADGVRLPFKANLLDGIFMSFTLELFDTPEILTVLSECRRTLRNGGRISVVALSQEEKVSLSERIYRYLHDMFPEYFDCRPICVEKALGDAGFRIENVTRFALFGLRGKIVLGCKG